MTQTFSRRHFLQLAGISFFGQFLELPEPSSAYYGRTFAATSVYQHPHLDAPIIRTLWPDSIVPITPVNASWYRSENGYIAMPQVQPLRHYAPTPTETEPPCWGEVVAPIAAVRAWCAADAPLVTRIGHSGIMRITSSLPGWYAISDAQDEPLGWSQALHWQAVNPRPIQTGALTIQVQQSRQQISISQRGQILLQAPISTNGNLASGTYPITTGKLGGTLHNGYYGAPWQAQIGQQITLAGVYWHNRFGTVQPGPEIQVTPIVAQWLYQRLNANSWIEIIS